MKKKKGNRKIYLITGIVVALVVLALFLLSLVDKQPPPAYVLRSYGSDLEEGYRDFLTGIPDSELVPFRCTMPFINNGENEYYWRLSYQHDLFDAVEDQLFKKSIETIDQTQAIGRILLSGRFCETEDGRVYLDYYTADKATSINENGYYHGREVEGFLTVIDDQGVLQNTIPFVTEDFWTYTGCKPVFQITTSEQLYMACGVTQTYGAESTLYRIDMRQQTTTPLYTCSYNRLTEYTKTCTLLAD